MPSYSASPSADQVVAGVLLALCGQLEQIPGGVHHGPHAGALGPALRVVGGHDRVGPVEQHRPVLVRHAEHLGDGAVGVARGDVLHEVALAGLDHLVDQPGDQRPDRRLDGGHPARGERGVHDAAHPGVLRRIAPDHHHAHDLERGDVLDVQDPALAATTSRSAGRRARS
jgi:hypothetical protein